MSLVTPVPANSRKSALKRSWALCPLGPYLRGPGGGKTVLFWLSVHTISRAVGAHFLLFLALSLPPWLFFFFIYKVSSKKAVSWGVGIHLHKPHMSQSLTSSLIGMWGPCPLQQPLQLCHPAHPRAQALTCSAAGWCSVPDPWAGRGEAVPGNQSHFLSILDSAGMLGWSQHSAHGAGGFDHLSSGCPFPVKRTENVHAVLAGLLAGVGPG